jgi:hypothetical protein
MFMTGDEISYPALSRHVVETIIGDALDEDIPTAEVVAELQKSYIPFFIIPDYGRARVCERYWRDLLGDHVLTLESPIDVCYVAAGAMLLSEGRVDSVKQLAEVLGNAGMSSDRRSHVVTSLTPYAEVVLRGK